MKKKDFTRKARAVDLLLKIHLASSTEITYVILLHTETNREHYR